MLALATLLCAHAAPDTFLESSVGVSYFNLGARYQGKAGLTFDLWSKEDSLLFGETYVRTNAVTKLSPAYARIGPEVVFAPIAVFNVSAHYTASAYFGTFSSILGFDDPGAVYDDDAQDAVIDAGLRGTGTAIEYGGDVTLQGAAGPILIATWATWTYWNTQPSDVVVGDYYPEPDLDLMLAFGGETVSGLDGVLLYEMELSNDRTLLVGNISYWRVTDRSNDEQLKSGLIAIYQPDDNWAAMVLAQAYFEDRVYTELFPPYLAAQVRWRK